MAQITADGKSVLVTLNLCAALMNLRQNSTPRTLWIDAICINQAGENEKTQQVQQMKKIYSQADKVIGLGKRISSARSRLLRLNVSQIIGGGIAPQPHPDTRLTKMKKML
jgi:hypothetical protein